MTREHDTRLETTRPFGVRVEALRGELAWTGGPPLRSVARRLALWWPGGAWVWAWPVAIEVPAGDGGWRRQRIGVTRPRVLGALMALGLIACVVGLARLGAQSNMRRGTR